MSRINKTIAHLYNPLNQDKKTLLKNFVIRKKEFSKIFRDIKNSKLNQTSQNFLIQGQRGSGKTTLLAKLKYEIEDSEDLSHLLPVQFAEEQYNIFSLNGLWENVADIIEETNGFQNIVEEMEGLDDEDDFYFLLQQYLKKNKKKLVLLIDNFGDILDKLKEKEHKKLRDILHESDLQIIAGSTRTLETAYKHDKPFFESFKTIYLESLTPNEVLTLLENLNNQYDDKNASEILENQRGRIETIRRLTGGIPRTIILLYEIITDDSANVFEDLEGLLDKITPLYKHKMDDLPTQQQVIVNALALNWDGMLTSEISKKTKIETKKISAQFKILEKNGFVTSTLVNKKNKIYMLQERFFNIWYLMRYGRKKNKQHILWLVSFLRDWCTEKELIRKAQKHIALANAGELNQRGGYYMAEALTKSLQDPELQYEILNNTKKYISKYDPVIADSLSDPGDIALIVAYKAYKGNEFKKAEKYYLNAIEHKNVIAMFGIALLYHTEFKDYNNAERYYLKAIQNNNNEAMFYLAILYHTELKDYKKAEKYYLMAVKNNKHEAMFNLAVLYHTEFKDLRQSEKFYSRAIKNDFEHSMNLLINMTFDDVEMKDSFLSISSRYHKQTDHISSLALSILMIHAEDYKKSVEHFTHFLKLSHETNNFQRHITNYFILLISKKQYHLAMELFQDEEFKLKGDIKPVYYALMHLMKEEYPKEYKRMGAELSETVNEILDAIKALES